MKDHYDPSAEEDLVESDSSLPPLKLRRNRHMKNDSKTGSKTGSRTDKGYSLQFSNDKPDTDITMTDQNEKDNQLKDQEQNTRKEDDFKASLEKTKGPCTNGFGGERCETHASAHSQAQSSDMKQMITIVVPVVIGVVLILVILLIVILYRRRSCPGNYSGKLCNASACGDYCFNDGQCTKCTKDSSTGRYKCSACSCTNGFGGERCETHASAHSQAQSSDMKQMITIVVPVVIGVVLILVILLIVILYRRRRDQFKHQRMHNSNMEINNPIYIARQPGDGEIEGQGSEIEPLDIEGEDHVLLSKDSDSEEALDKNGDLNFYGSKGNPKKSNA
ncbi:unnamed protein product [Mytilus coruscus]|uniref:EGF-like domain-containing protein n=1 Tax=Mytilus coruscus TaxID=42192 RepID=A0A6J8F2C1_MYTCO|nr:unnamed protein product [Mytilus coruscus]